MGPLALPDDAGHDLLRGAWLAANGVTALWVNWLVLLHVSAGHSVTLKLGVLAIVPIAVLVLWFKAMLLPAAAVSAAFVLWMTVETTHYFGREQWTIWIYLAIAVWRLVTVARHEPASPPSGSGFAARAPASAWRNLMRLFLGCALLVFVLAVAAAVYVASSDEAREGFGGLLILVAGVVGVAALGAAIVGGIVLVVGRWNSRLAVLVSMPLAAWALWWGLPNGGHGWVNTVVSLWAFSCLSAALATLTTPTAVPPEISLGSGATRSM